MVAIALVDDEDEVGEKEFILNRERCEGYESKLIDELCKLLVKDVPSLLELSHLR